MRPSTEVSLSVVTPHLAAGPGQFSSIVRLAAECQGILEVGSASGAHSDGLMFALSRKKLVGSYLFFTATNLS